MNRITAAIHRAIFSSSRYGCRLQITRQLRAASRLKVSVHGPGGRQPVPGASFTCRLPVPVSVICQHNFKTFSRKAHEMCNFVTVGISVHWFEIQRLNCNILKYLGYIVGLFHAVVMLDKHSEFVYRYAGYSSITKYAFLNYNYYLH